MHFQVMTSFCFILQTKKARSALGLARGPDPGGGGPDLAQGTGDNFEELTVELRGLLLSENDLTVVSISRCRRSRSRSRRRSASRSRRRSRSPRRKRTRSRDRGRRSRSRSRCVAAAIAVWHLIHMRLLVLTFQCTMCPQRQEER